MSEWRTIETAPQDGTRIMVSDHEVTYIAFWRDECQYGKFKTGPGWQVFDCDDAYYSWSVTPTHWMPLPPPPVDARDAKPAGG